MNTITRREETRSVQDRPQIGKIATVPQSHYCFIDDTMTKNDECTAVDLKELLTAKLGAENVQYSERTISRIRS